MENRYRDNPPTEQGLVDMSTHYIKGGQTRGKGRKVSRRSSSETDSEPDSPDQLDLLSSPSRGDDDDSLCKDKMLKQLRFKKTKSQGSEDGPSKENRSSIAEDVFGAEMPQKKTYSRAGGRAKASSSQSTRRGAPMHRVTSPTIEIPSDSDNKEPPTRPTRPPRPFPGPSRTERSHSREARSSQESGASPVSKPKAKRMKPQPQSYPALSPLHTPKKIQPKSPSPKSKTIQRQPFPSVPPLSSPVTSKSTLNLPSPLSTPTNKKPTRLRQLSALPLPSPLNSQQSTITVKGKGRVASQPTKGKSQGKDVIKSKSWRVVSSEEEGENCVDETKPTRRPQPFPVAFSPQLTPRAPKRSSDGLESGEDKSRKKRREHILKTPPDADSDEEDDSAADNAIFLDPSIDPKTLCPYCDTRLPDRPTPLLSRLLANIAKKSRPSPRPTNPLGRKAPLEAFIALCQRHRFESVTLPEAERNGWPKEIAWEKLEGRVHKMKRELNTLISDPIARSSSVFWTEIMEEVKAKGSRAVGGVKNQFATFEKTQPGYYGEQGSVIIHQTLFNLFPPASIHPDQVTPLTPNEFTQRILVPEVAVRLIRQDMDVSPSKALKILRESSSYGVAMFPEDDSGWGEKKDDDVMGVADLMVMARARKRRIELEQEEREEEEMLKRKQEAEIVDVDPAPPSRPKPKPIRKHKPQTSTDSTSESGVVSESEELEIGDFVLGSDDPEPEPQITPPPTTLSDTDDDGGIITVDEDIRPSSHVDIDLTRDSRSRSRSTSDVESSTSRSSTGTRRSRAHRRLRGGDPPSDAESTASKQLAKYKSGKRDISEEAQPPRAPVRVDDAETLRPVSPTYPLLVARELKRRAGK
ncbi:RTC4-like domain-containing protein [Desarmillaria tabescens]|uniref:Restriction of telomere capping protein 4 n=1 Tax=Armillaria tabescens TaxID=1929756 RepID=A0AA39N588_ARMTA|nr:RTC4-like domain-containing protein [Desarmillaria tabescens]KAK0457879.1 RTC4-like domain-containing protein [Desarmillaria tabescens]